MSVNGDLIEGAKHLADYVSFGTLLAVAVQLLPTVASLLTVVWMAIRIYETDTVQRWVGRKRG